VRKRRGATILPAIRQPEITIEEAGRIADELRYTLNFAESMVSALASALNSVRVRSMAPEADRAILAVLDVLSRADRTIRTQRNDAHHKLCARALRAARREK